jgi:hypothetical protein
MGSPRDEVRLAIKLASTWEEADGVITTSMGIKDTSEKLGFLQGLFDINILGRCDPDDVTNEEKAKTDYIAVLSAIVGRKWK